MLFKSLQSIVSKSLSSVNYIENKNLNGQNQSKNNVSLLDNAKILSGNNGNNINILGNLTDN
ncbi:hypothetical protein RB653_001184 [Dictyostelium firmibasis]|uniref:Uncharacterized protein n=1 Tax=Dictyostelium firmibasis TaxID=79012 RepID=A0AAN7U3V9_9MYCE